MIRHLHLNHYHYQFSSYWPLFFFRGIVIWVPMRDQFSNFGGKRRSIHQVNSTGCRFEYFGFQIAVGTHQLRGHDDFKGSPSSPSNRILQCFGGLRSNSWNNLSAICDSFLADNSLPRLPSVYNYCGLILPRLNGGSGFTGFTSYWALIFKFPNLVAKFDAEFDFGTPLLDSRLLKIPI